MAKYPGIIVEAPTSSNIFAITTKVIGAMRKASIEEKVIDEFRIAVMSVAPSMIVQEVKCWVVYTAPKSV